MNRKAFYPVSWVPTVYFAMGLPFVVLNMVSVLMFKGLDISDAQIALWTSLIMLPWTLKFLWSPFLEMFKTKSSSLSSRRLLQESVSGLLLCHYSFLISLPAPLRYWR